MASLIDMPFATIDIKDDCGSKYWKWDWCAYYPGYLWTENREKHQCILQMFTDCMLCATYFAVLGRTLIWFEKSFILTGFYNWRSHKRLVQSPPVWGAVLQGTSSPGGRRGWTGWASRSLACLHGSRLHLFGILIYSQCLACILNNKAWRSFEKKKISSISSFLRKRWDSRS